MSRIEYEQRGAAGQHRQYAGVPAAPAWWVSYGVMRTSTREIVDHYVDHDNAVLAKRRLEAQTRETYIVRKCG